MTAETQEATSTIRENAAERQRNQREERVELTGVARDLFVNRYEDTFEIDIHDTSVEFYRPVDADGVDVDGLEEDTVERIEEGSRLLTQFERRQESLLRSAQSGNIEISDLLDESMEGVELMARVLAAHAVDESLTDHRVWRSIYRNDDKLSELFEDFIAEGESESNREKLNALDGMLSGNSSSS